MKSVKKINTTEFEIIKAQELWAQNVIEIGDLFIKNKDYKSKASIFVKEFYAFDLCEVLFKPTLASEKQFRFTYDDALSYFIGGSIAEDRGFALQPWKKIVLVKEKLLFLKIMLYLWEIIFFKVLLIPMK